MAAYEVLASAYQANEYINFRREGECLRVIVDNKGCPNYVIDDLIEKITQSPDAHKLFEPNKSYSWRVDRIVSAGFIDIVYVKIKQWEDSTNAQGVLLVRGETPE